MINRLTISFVILILLYHIDLTVGQNLVPNPSFENHDTLPSYNTNLLSVSYCQDWRKPNLGTPDYLNNNYFSSTFFQAPRTGDGYVGFIGVNWNGSGYREYLQARLLAPLVAGETYSVEFYLSLADYRHAWTDDFGVYFSCDSIDWPSTDSLPYVPQVENQQGNYVTDKNNWVLISAMYLALGGEKYITIGNFKGPATTSVQGNSSNQAYYYMDDVSVVLVPNPGMDSALILCSNDPPVDLFGYLGGTPTAGGTWTPALNSGTGVFDPNIDSPGLYSYTLNSCTGTVTSANISVAVNAVSIQVSTVTICGTDSILLGGEYQSMSGIYTDSLVDVNGCDSIIVTDLTVHQSAIGNGGSIIGCDSALSNGNWYFTSQTIIDTLLAGASSGCDSIVSTTLVINNSITVYDSLEACDDADINGNVYTTSQTVIDLFPTGAINGCDSTVITELVINHSEGTMGSPILTCDSVELTGQWYHPDDTLVVLYSNVEGCDSVVRTSIIKDSIRGEAQLISTPISCYGENDGAIISLEIGGVTPYSYEWNNGQTTNKLSMLSMGEYMLTLTDANGCDTTLKTIVSEPDEILIASDLMDDTCQRAVGSISVEVTGGVLPYTYTWSPIAKSGESITGLTLGSYAVTITDSEECKEAEVHIIGNVEDGCVEPNVYLPNIFSPDKDGINDQLFVLGNGIKEHTLNIYDRWGNLVFTSSDISIGWDGIYKGRKLNSGVFAYFLIGEFETGETFREKGNITLVR